MRIWWMAALLPLAACDSGEPDERATTGPGEGLGPGFYELGERSGLCASSDDSAAFVIYGEDGTNCMAQGAIETTDEDALAFAPRGDAQCRIPIEDLGQSIRLGDGGAACRYYCGGSTDYAGRELVKNWDDEPDLRDGAGDPLC